MSRSAIVVRPETDGSEMLPAEPGAYVLTLDVERALALRIATLPRIHLPPGRYAYIGSAKGAGGIRARVRRHLTRGKKLHWHVDHITAAGLVVEVTAYPGAEECDIADDFLAGGGASTPVAGFGSSDCKRCAAHFLSLG